MQLYKRPEVPEIFQSSKVTKARARAEQRIEARLTKVGAKKTRSRPRKDWGVSGKTRKKNDQKDFDEVWKEFKAFFSYAQFEKCGFCESRIMKTSRGDVEHYRPKSEISLLDDDPATHGKQREGLAGVKGRRPKVICSTGYYWLAYDWENYLLACSACNQDFKGTLFPVRDNPRQLPPQREYKGEQPLLLNPFHNKSPSRHLKFLDHGFVLAKSPYGRATIDTCGLYRASLVVARGKIATRAYTLARDLRKSRQPKDPQVLRDCYTIGADDAEHCGMVRCIIEDIAGFSWEELIKKCAKESALELKRTKNLQKRKELEEFLENMGRKRYEHSEAVRTIFEKTCGISWDQLVKRHAVQRAKDFLVIKRDWQQDSKYELNLKLEFYMLARDNPGQAVAVKESYEKHCRMDWRELKLLVESTFDLLWKVEGRHSEK